MKVVGPMVDVENPNKFVFLRGFPTMEDLHRMKDEFYGGKLWKEELEQIAMPMIESYDVILCETTPASSWTIYGRRRNEDIASLACVLLLAVPDVLRKANRRPRTATVISISRSARGRRTLKRRLRPLSGSNEWVEYEGTSVVTKVLGGRANIVELDVKVRRRIEGMSLRLLQS
jgi:hypothetical protein